MAKKNRTRTDGMIDCACVIHGSGYKWEYVEKLYNMLTRLIPQGIRMHVYTEHDRSVPPHMVKHILDDWGISGPKKSWWYKMQLFNREHFAGNMLYLDLDVVIVRELDWVTKCHTEYFWALRDFRYLQNRGAQTLNSSMMWFNVDRFGWVWDDFQKLNLESTVRRYPGDQDYIVQAIDINKRRFFDDKYFESYRWQVMDGGYNFQTRRHNAPGTGATIAPDTSVIVFHGHPKPHECNDPKIVTLWV